MVDVGGGRRHRLTIQSGDHSLELTAYRSDALRTLLFYVLTVATLGVFRLIMHWKEKWHVRLRMVPCTFQFAEFIYIVDNHNVAELQEVYKKRHTSDQPVTMPQPNGMFSDVEEIRWFIYRKQHYVWIEEENEDGNWIQSSEIANKIPISWFLKTSNEGKGFDQKEIFRRLDFYGRNEIVVKLRPIFYLLVMEVITPFYVFQIFSVTVWYNDEYAYYASLIVVLSVGSIITDIYHIRSQEKRLRSMVHSSEDVEVIRESVPILIRSEELVPGDILLIPPHGGLMHCDAVLMNGTVIVNESVLTGESVPITKVALTDDGHDTVFSMDAHAKNIIYCGTQVLQTRFYQGQKVKAIVLRTAYSTLKGQLVRSIMYPKPVDFRFTKDLFKFILFLACISGCGFIYTIILMISRGNTMKKVLIRALDIITITVPPALPAAMSVGIINAQLRLKKKQIFCISPSAINTCGAINVVCFDKTGTLTEDGLDFHVMRPVEQKEDGAVFSAETTEMNKNELPQGGEIVHAIATCHSLTRINGVLHGDPLDLILFQKTRWTLEEGSDEQETMLFDSVQPTFVRGPQENFGKNEEFSIVRQFTFSSSLQRMSVIVYDPNSDSPHAMTVYTKGSPEMILSLCDPKTVPKDYLALVNAYAQHGFRLISVARRTLDINFNKANCIGRNAVECNLQLLGLVAMENRIKPVTLSVINQLNRAQIRTVMVTGDNLLTALSVARECGIIRPTKKTFLVEHKTGMFDQKGRTLVTIKQSVSSSEDIFEDENVPVTKGDLEVQLGNAIGCNYHFAISGATFAVLCHEYSELVEQLVCVCDVFARMAPDQKQMLVEQLQAVSYTVAMCGDGANDCQALKAAHAGISLSDAEASIAAPFTSKVADIRCVPTVISEGRAALVTSFGIFKYMAGYSLTQFVTVMQLYWISNILTDGQFMYIDMFLITMFALVFGNTPAYPRLAPTPPPTRLLSVASIASVVGQLLIMLTSQLIIFISTSKQPWFVPYTPPVEDGEEDKRSMQGTAIFCVSMFQYITLAVVYSKGPPYRGSIFSNRLFCALVIFSTIVSVFIVLDVFPWTQDLIGNLNLPAIEFRVLILFVAAINALVSYLYEKHVVDQFLLGYWERYKKKRSIEKNVSYKSMKQDGQEYEENENSALFERIIARIGNDPTWVTSSHTLHLDDVAETETEVLTLTPRSLI